MLTDNDIINYFWGDKKNLKKEKLNNINLDIKQYLEHRYSDSLSILETINRIKLNIENHPICPICNNNLVKYKGKYLSSNIFFTTCDNVNCKKSYKIYKMQLTKLNKYGDSNYNNYNKMLQTKLERYGDSNYHNIEKMKQTCLERYGVENGGGIEQSIKKIKNTKLKNHGNENFVNIEKIKKTKLEKYGCENFVNNEKAKQTKLERYGDSNYHNIEKMKQTCLERYGVENGGGIEQSLLKSKITCLKKYNTEYYFQSNKFKENLNYDEINKKRCITKTKNNTYNTSKTENESYILLNEKFNEVKRNYKSKSYPFLCDFYIPSINTYIECNYHWTHGKKPYNKNDEYSINLINTWKNKNTKYYNNAINTFSIRDVNKRNIAKENNLNWIEFFNINELKEWLSNIQ